MEREQSYEALKFGPEEMKPFASEMNLGCVTQMACALHRSGRHWGDPWGFVESMVFYVFRHFPTFVSCVFLRFPTLSCNFLELSPTFSYFLSNFLDFLYPPYLRPCRQCVRVYPQVHC